MKKLISALSASILALSALPVVTASAVNVIDEDILSVSAETLSESLTIDETVIPVGAVAVTVSVSDNSGFISTTAKLDYGSFDVITNEKGIPAVVTGNATEGSLVTGSVNDGIGVFTTIGAKEYDGDGSLFTFYVNGDIADISDITVSDFETIGFDDISNSIRTVSALSNYGQYYRIGDVNNDGYIDAVDSTITEVAIGENGGNKIRVADANADLRRFFVETTVCAQTADANISGEITVTDANDISLYYACMAAHQDEEEALQSYRNQTDGGHCGEYKFYRG